MADESQPRLPVDQLRGGDGACPQLWTDAGERSSSARVAERSVDQQRVIWQQVLNHAQETGKPITAAMVASFVDPPTERK